MARVRRPAAVVTQTGYSGRAQKRDVTHDAVTSSESGLFARAQISQDNSSSHNDLANLGAKVAPETYTPVQTTQADAFDQVVEDYLEYRRSQGSRSLHVSGVWLRLFCR